VKLFQSRSTGAISAGTLPGAFPKRRISQHGYEEAGPASSRRGYLPDTCMPALFSALAILPTPEIAT